MWLMLQQNKPGDFVCSTGISHSVRDLIAYCFSRVGIGNWQAHVRRDEKYLRPEDLINLRGDSTKAKKELK